MVFPDASFLSSSLEDGVDIFVVQICLTMFSATTGFSGVKLKSVPKDEIRERTFQGSTDNYVQLKPTVQPKYTGLAQVVLIISKTAWVVYEWLSPHIKKVRKNIFDFVMSYKILIICKGHTTLFVVSSLRYSISLSLPMCFSLMFRCQPLAVLFVFTRFLALFFTALPYSESIGTVYHRCGPATNERDQGRGYLFLRAHRNLPRPH